MEPKSNNTTKSDNLSDNDIETESEDYDTSNENDDRPNTINGELMAGSVEHIDDI